MIISWTKISFVVDSSVSTILIHVVQVEVDTVLTMNTGLLAQHQQICLMSCTFFQFWSRTMKKKIKEFDLDQSFSYWGLLLWQHVHLYVTFFFFFFFSWLIVCLKVIKCSIFLSLLRRKQQLKFKMILIVIHNCLRKLFIFWFDKFIDIYFTKQFNTCCTRVYYQLINALLPKLLSTFIW